MIFQEEFTKNKKQNEVFSGLINDLYEAEELLNKLQSTLPLNIVFQEDKRIQDYREYLANLEQQHQEELRQIQNEITKNQNEIQNRVQLYEDLRRKGFDIVNIKETLNLQVTLIQNQKSDQQLLINDKIQRKEFLINLNQKYEHLGLYKEKIILCHKTKIAFFKFDQDQLVELKSTINLQFNIIDRISISQKWGQLFCLLKEQFLSVINLDDLSEINYFRCLPRNVPIRNLIVLDTDDLLILCAMNNKLKVTWVIVKHNTQNPRMMNFKQMNFLYKQNDLNYFYYKMNSSSPSKNDQNSQTKKVPYNPILKQGTRTFMSPKNKDIQVNQTKERFKNETQDIKQVVKVRELLGKQGNQIADLLEGQRNVQNEIKEFFTQLSGDNILDVQDKRVARLIAIFHNVFVDALITQESAILDGRAEGFKLASEIFKQEVTNIVETYKNLIREIERNSELIQRMKDDKIVLLTDYQSALELLVRSYSKFEQDQEKQNSNISLVQRSIHHFKINIQLAPQNKREYLLIAQLEDLLRNNYNTIVEQTNKIKILEEENLKLNKLCEDRSSEKYVADLWNSHMTQVKQFEVKNQKIDDSQYQRHIKKLMHDNKTLKDELQFLERKIQLQKNEQNRVTMVAKRFVDKSDSENKEQDQYIVKEKNIQTLEQSVQCNYITLAQPNFKREEDYFEMCKRIEQLPGIGQQQSKEWVQAIINTIYVDKIICDLQDYSEVRTAMRFPNFSYFWFLRKFGVKQIAFQFYSDFYFSLKANVRQSEKLAIFSNFSGYEFGKSLLQKGFEMNESVVDQKISEGVRLRRNLFIQQYYQSLEAVSLALYVASMHRNLPLVKPENSRNAPGQTFLFPDEFKQGYEMLKINRASKIIQDILTEAGFVVNNFDQTLKKVVVEDNREKSSQKQVKDKDDDSIRLDSFIRVVLNIFMEQRYKAFDQIFTQLNQKSRPPGESQIQFQDFQTILQTAVPRLTDKGTENLFKIFHKGLIYEQTPLENTLLNLIPYIFDDQQFKPFYPYIDRRNFLFKPVQKNIDGTLSGEMVALQKVNMLIYDSQTQLSLQTEVYNSVKTIIESEEELNDNLQITHSQFSGQLGTLEYSLFSKGVQDKTQIIQKLENNWVLLRKMIYLLQLETA